MVLISFETFFFHCCCFLFHLTDFSFVLSGLLPPGTQFDLFRGTAAMKQDVDDMYPTTLGHTIKVRCNISFLVLVMFSFFRPGGLQ